jgi:hypothetical protein
VANLHWDRYLDLNGWALVEGFEETEFKVGGHVFGTIQYLHGNYDAKWQPDGEYSTNKLGDAFMNVERAAFTEGHQVGPAAPEDKAIRPDSSPRLL